MAKTLRFYGVENLNRTLRALPREASVKLRDASQVIAAKVSTDASGAARAQGGLSAIVAPTIRAGRDRVPVIRMGNSSRLPASGNGWERARGGSRQTIGDVIWGAEFGGGARPTTRQFRPHKGQTGYFLWPTVRGDGDFIEKAYGDALMEAVDEA